MGDKSPKSKKRDEKQKATEKANQKADARAKQERSSPTSIIGEGKGKKK